jgi:hypothetical protein
MLPTEYMFNGARHIWYEVLCTKLGQPGSINLNSD